MQSNWQWSWLTFTFTLTFTLILDFTYTWTWTFKYTFTYTGYKNMTYDFTLTMAASQDVYIISQGFMYCARSFLWIGDFQERNPGSLLLSLPCLAPPWSFVSSRTLNTRMSWSLFLQIRIHLIDINMIDWYIKNIMVMLQVCKQTKGLQVSPF